MVIILWVQHFVNQTWMWNITLLHFGFQHFTSVCVELNDTTIRNSMFCNVSCPCVFYELWLSFFLLFECLILVVLVPVLCGYWNRLMWYFLRTLDIQESCFIITELKHPLYVYCKCYFGLPGIACQISFWLELIYVSRWAITSLTNMREEEQFWNGYSRVKLSLWLAMLGCLALVIPEQNWSVDPS